MDSLYILVILVKVFFSDFVFKFWSLETWSISVIFPVFLTFPLSNLPLIVFSGKVTIIRSEDGRFPHQQTGECVRITHPEVSSKTSQTTPRGILDPPYNLL